jgi:lambda repressor-like predicted transcriptional regulator
MTKIVVSVLGVETRKIWGSKFLRKVDTYLPKLHDATAYSIVN